MKPEELSIGDWVNVLNYHWDGSPYTGQVNGITKKHGTYYLQFGSALSAEIDRCEPIPITMPEPEEVWEALNQDNKVSLYTNVSGEVRLFNKHLGD